MYETVSVTLSLIRLASCRMLLKMAHQSDVAARGRKRPAEGALDDQPLAKKFGRLQIGPLADLRLPECREQVQHAEPNLYKSDDAMMLDDTEHTLYIHDLEFELEESEPCGGALTILPGLENKLSMTKILVPEQKRACNEIILYREPESISIPKDKDKARRALIETRERARLGQQRPECDMQAGRASQDATRATGRNSWLASSLEDKMDLDAEVK